MSSRQEEFTTQSLILKHPGIKEIKGAFLAGKKEICISGIEGVEEQFLKAISDYLQSSFLSSANSKASFTVLKIGDQISNVHTLLNNYSYERKEYCESPGEYSVLGDTIIVWGYAYSSPVRLSFWGDAIEEIELVEPIAFKRTDKLEVFVCTQNAPVRIVNPYLKFNGFNVVIKDCETSIRFDFTDAPQFHSNINLLQKYIHSCNDQGLRVVISSKHTNKLYEKLKDVEFSSDIIGGGWNSKKIGAVILTDFEIFDSLATGGSIFEGEGIGFVESIEIGNYVVHRDHGIAVYGGIKEMRDKSGSLVEYLILNYAKEDKLYVPLSQLSKVSKYVGGKTSPRLTRLGTYDWDRVTGKVKKSIESISKELLELYAARKLSKGYVFSKDTQWQERLEESFPFEETKDQLRALHEIKEDMESDKSMDRLLVGDVGFGKTELAIRAAFKAIQDGKQVLVLAPTTILVEQHFAVFKDRLKDFPIQIEALSRFQGRKKNLRIIDHMKSGVIDIVIGTHRLLSEDVQVKNLGLIVVDEEQRFGVKQKERLKRLRKTVDVLSMSATPIPRTLHMALSGIRDISILAQPPKGRIPIKTYLNQFDYEQIVKIIQYELKRDGQVYFVHNSIDNLNTIQSELQSRDPGMRIGIAHGQMRDVELSKVMHGFYEHKYDVLLCTTIIENGIDIPGVNTIIIDNSQRFGLSQLHQLRGRVGRSFQKAFCYLLYPEGYKLKGKSKKRLEALVSHQHLGAGFSIASKDLEIRGMGNLLGRDQSGSASAIGISLYIELLRQEIRKQKQILE